MKYILHYGEKDDIECELIWDDGPKFRNVFDGSYASDKPICIIPKPDLIDNISIVKLPYQRYWFVTGYRDGKNVWLTSKGEWTANEDHPLIPLSSNVTIQNLVDFDLLPKKKT